MKSRISLLLIIGLLAPVFFVGSSLAVEDEATTTDTTTTQPLSQTQKQELSERIEKRKAEAKLRLTAAQEKRLEARCKNAQGMVKKVSGRVNGIETNRTKVHTNLVGRLKKLEVRLAEKGLDTTEYKTQITELEAKIATFNTDMAAYKEAVTDLGNIEDCTADAAAFKASLDASRTALQKVYDDALAIRSYVNDTIKPSIKALRAQLETTETQETN